MGQRDIECLNIMQVRMQNMCKVAYKKNVVYRKTNKGSPIPFKYVILELQQVELKNQISHWGTEELFLNWFCFN